MKFINFDDIVNKKMKIILIKMYLYHNIFQIQLLLEQQDVQKQTYYSIF